MEMVGATGSLPTNLNTIIPCAGLMRELRLRIGHPFEEETKTISDWWREREESTDHLVWPDAVNEDAVPRSASKKRR